MQFRASIAIRMHVRSHVIRNRLIASCMHQDQPPWPRARAVRDVAPVDMRVSVLCTAVSRAASGQAPAAGRASWRTQPYRVEPWGGGLAPASDCIQLYRRSRTGCCIQPCHWYPSTVHRHRERWSGGLWLNRSALAPSRSGWASAGLRHGAGRLPEASGPPIDTQARGGGSEGSRGRRTSRRADRA